MLFDPFGGLPAVMRTTGRAGFLPAADLTVGANDFVLTIDLPGVQPDDLELEVLNDELVIRGERKQPQPADGTQWAYRERAFGRFERRVGLPKGVDAEAITASLDNGVLSLIVPKPEAIKPRSIAIGSASEQPQLAGSAA